MSSKPVTKCRSVKPFMANIFIILLRNLNAGLYSCFDTHFIVRNGKTITQQQQKKLLQIKTAFIGYSCWYFVAFTNYITTYVINNIASLIIALNSMRVHKELFYAALYHRHLHM